MKRDDQYFNDEAQYAARRFEQDSADRWNTSRSVMFRHRYSITKWCGLIAVCSGLAGTITHSRPIRIALFAICLGALFLSFVPIARGYTQTTVGAFLRTLGCVGLILTTTFVIGLLFVFLFG